MIKLYKNKNMKLKTKIGLTISVLAFFIAIANLFIGNEFVKLTVWTMCVCVFAIAGWSMCEDIEKLSRKNLLQAYEIACLRDSYRSMGKYIEYKNLPELDDIETRINNEFADIEIKKEHYAESIGARL